AASLDEGLTVYFPAIPALKPGETEPYRLREATVDDVPLLQRLLERHRAGAALWTEIEDEYWRWAMAGMHPEGLERWRTYVITAADDQAGHADGASAAPNHGLDAGRSVGALTLFAGRWGAAVAVNRLMVEAGTPLVRVVPSVLRALQALAETT